MRWRPGSGAPATITRTIRGRPGSYHRDADRFVIATREFRFWDSMEPARRLEIGFDAGVVRRIDASGDDVPIVRLDPAPHRAASIPVTTRTG